MAPGRERAALRGKSNDNASLVEGKNAAVVATRKLTSDTDHIPQRFSARVNAFTR